MEEQDNINQKNITDKWLDNIYEILMRLEGYERLAKEGCISILDYVQNPAIELDMAQIQNKNYNLFITEFEVLLNNVKHLIDAPMYLKMMIKFNSLLKFENELGGYLKRMYNDVEHRQWYEIKPEFYYAQRQITALRGMAVESLWKLLTPNARESFKGMPK